MTTHAPDPAPPSGALEALHEGLIDAPISVGILHGPDHVVRFANARFVEVFGGRELIGRSAREAAPEVAAEGWFEILDRIYATGEGVTAAAAPATVVRDGRPVVTFHNLTLQPIRDASGAVAGISIAGVEVTDQVRSRAAAEQEEQRFRTFVDSLEAVVWEGQEEPGRPGAVRVEYVSGHAERMFGHPVRRWLEEPTLWQELIHPDDAGRRAAVFERDEATAGERDVEYRARTTDGRTLWVREIVHIRPGEGGERRRFSGVLVDVTARKEAEALTDAVIDTAPEGFALFDTELRYLRVNEALARINGVPAEEHLGRTLCDVVPGIPDEGHVEPLRRVLATGRPVVDLEVRGVTRGAAGDPGTWLVSYFPVRDTAGRIVRLGAIITDITERKHAEERSALLAELGAILDEVVSLEDRLARLEQALVPRLGDECSVTLLRPGDRLEPGGLTGDAVIAPMYASGRVIGQLTLRRSRPWTRHEVELVEQLAQRAAAAIEAARLFDSERAARERMARLQAVTAGLSEAVGPTDVARAVIDEGMAWLGASMAAVWQVDADGQALELIGHKGWTERAQRVPMQRIELAAPLPVPDAVRNRRPVWLPDQEAKAAAYPALAARAVGTSPEALYVLPLTAGTGPVGAIALCFSHPALLDGETRAFAAALAAQCAQALERARLYESERRVATILQRSLLPACMPEVPGAEFAVRYLPAAGLEAGGDFYEAVRLPSGAVGVAVGDVVGRGAGAAATMGQLRAALRAFALQGEPPAIVLAQLSTYAQTIPGGLAATAAYAVLDVEGGTLRYACAGHPFPMLARADGSAELLREGRSVPLAVAKEPVYTEAVVDLRPGDTLLLYTDGVVERRGEQFDAALERLRTALGTLACEPLDRLLDDIVTRQGIDSPVDDVALLAVRLAPVRAETREIRIPAEPGAVAEARAALRGWLTEAGVPADALTDVLLASGEAVANAVEHAYADAPKRDVALQLRLRERDLELSVRDQGRWRSTPGDASRGRGFGLMRALMDEVIVERADSGTHLVLRTHVPPGAPASPPPPAGPATLERGNDPLTVRLSGDVDLACADSLRAQLEKLARSGPLVADLSAVSYLDSSGLRMLVEVTRAAAGGFSVVAPSGTPARRALDLAGVDGVVVVADR